VQDREDMRPRVALTMGDVAGVGPEIIAKAWSREALHRAARPFVVGSRAVLERAIDRRVGSHLTVVPIDQPEQARPNPEEIPCLDVAAPDVADLEPRRVDARAGLAAYQFLVAAIDLALAGRVDAITTLPLNKESLRLARVPHPGHTEILGERCGVDGPAMMLLLTASGDDRVSEEPPGLGVVHVTLHVPLRAVFELLTVERIAHTIALAYDGMRPLTRGRPPSVAVAGLNPHAGENGLFGDEEGRLIAPAIAQAQAAGIKAIGPVAADTLFASALGGEFDAVVAMYHDQGHVALKTVGFDRAGQARPESLIRAVRVGVRLVAGRRSLAGAQSHR
jgi:4-hydroxythreonine-4-phosphate dehydrogenase